MNRYQLIATDLFRHAVRYFAQAQYRCATGTMCEYRAYTIPPWVPAAERPYAHTELRHCVIGARWPQLTQDWSNDVSSNSYDLAAHLDLVDDYVNYFAEHDLFDLDGEDLQLAQLWHLMRELQSVHNDATNWLVPEPIDQLRGRFVEWRSLLSSVQASTLVDLHAADHIMLPNGGRFGDVVDLYLNQPGVTA